MFELGRSKNMADQQELDAVLNALTPVTLLNAMDSGDHYFKNIVLLCDKDAMAKHNTNEFISVATASEDEMEDESMSIDEGESNPNKDRELMHKRYHRGIARLSKIENLVNISNIAYWKASSFKNLNPVENVINDDPESYWQSDGSQPHSIDIYFSKRVEITLLAMFFGFVIDESYSPKVIKVYIGDSPSDLNYFEEWHIERITQWYVRKFTSFEEIKRSNETRVGRKPPVKCQMIRFVFPVNHDNGKDTHLRGIRIYSRDDGHVPLATADMTNVITGNSEQVVTTIDPKSKFNDGFYSIR